jgi:hypothetical protein
MRGDDISERLLDFAVRIIRLVSALPKLSSANMSRDNWFAVALARARIMKRHAAAKAERTSSTSSAFPGKKRANHGSG